MAGWQQSTGTHRSTTTSRRRRPRARPALRTALGPLLVASLVLVGPGTGPVAAATFSTSTPVVITSTQDPTFTCFLGDPTPTLVTPASPYPSQVPVSGLAGTVTDVNATFTVTTSGSAYGGGGDLMVLLVGPSGGSVVLTADNGYDYAANAVVLTFDDEAASPLPPSFAPLQTGTYQPSPNGPGGNGCNHPSSLPPPAPGAPYGSALSVFDGTAPNGAWSLYAISDTLRGTTLTISSWSLDITTAVSHTISPFAAPVDNLPIRNVAKAGAVVPLKFAVTTSSGAPVTGLTAADVSVTSAPGGDNCGTSVGTDSIEQYSGGSGLQYLGGGSYQYNWKTPKTYAGSCRTLTLETSAGGERSAVFSFVR